MSFLTWLIAEREIKRWLSLIIIGTIFMSLGFGFILKEIYEQVNLPEWVYYASLQFLPRTVRALVVTIIGTSMIILALGKLYYSLNQKGVRSA